MYARGYELVIETEYVEERSFISPTTYTYTYETVTLWTPQGDDYMVFKCDLCSALVDTFDRDKHVRWHEALAQALERVLE